MEIVHLTTEIAPFAKVGGLADVIYGLSHAQVKNQDHVEVILPKYEKLNLSLIEPYEVIVHDLMVLYAEKEHHCTVWQGKMHGILVTLIESHDATGFFEREHIYGYPDDTSRFTYFSVACMEILKMREKKPDIIHIHDWPTALVAPLVKKALFPSRVVFTIHNLAYQGICDEKTFNQTGLDAKSYLTPDLLQDVQYPHLLNLLKGALVYADAVTTVSPTYAKEILSFSLGGLMHKVLQKYEKKIVGILNGIDFQFWNPSQDLHLPHSYSHEEIQNSVPFLQNKLKNKEHLRRTLGLNENSPSPLVAVIARLCPQKGPDLIQHAIHTTLKMGGQFVLIGTTTDPETHDSFYALKCELAPSCQVHIELSYNESLAHLLFAAADLFLVPSLFEPCGLTQMIAMRYGTLPLVRETGGLVDTVFDIDNAELPEKKRNGFSFLPYSAEGIERCLERAFALFRSDPLKWRNMMEVGMKTDFSWEAPAKTYHDLYAVKARVL